MSIFIKSPWFIITEKGVIVKQKKASLETGSLKWFGVLGFYDKMVWGFGVLR